ncbi:hypothetical protein KK062_27165 [Fulvivirgaceae bacterium PWU5]|uniref:Uncharacterized protein n=1 Tax=Dawidia cretensis TaxID=2782350 RepID=A0AAP2E2M7_9BACT|nr:hypothetical protein [Dawidia cretensis]MBT1711953.1 hypothetical protein [Dawidia cretensis]
MDVHITYIERLMEMLAAKTKQRLDNKGFIAMEIEISEGITKKYLYESMYLKTKKARESGIETVPLNQSKLDVLAQYLGAKSFIVLCDQLDKERSPVLMSCLGNYYCYVRRNAEIGVVMRSPVRIIEKNNTIWFELQGPTWLYAGEMLLKNGCLFICMRATGGKEIHHVYKIGFREQPPVMQGIFSGVSTVFEPIGGRTVLIRTQEDFTKLENLELKIADMKRSKDKEQRRLAEYFLSYETNNLKIKPVTTFTVDDLGNGK